MPSTRDLLAYALDRQFLELYAVVLVGYELSGVGGDVVPLVHVLGALGVPEALLAAVFGGLALLVRLAGAVLVLAGVVAVLRRLLLDAPTQQA